MSQTQEKSKVITERLGIELHKATFPIRACICGLTFSSRFEVSDHVRDNNPDFFHLDIKERRNAQAILAQALLGSSSKEQAIFVLFLNWLEKEKPIYLVALADNILIKWLTIIADTKLAELFIEFIESRK